MGVHAFACRRAIGRHVSVQESVQGEGGMLVLEHGFNVAHSCVKARGVRCASVCWDWFARVSARAWLCKGGCCTDVRVHQAACEDGGAHVCMHIGVQRAWLCTREHLNGGLHTHACM